MYKFAIPNFRNSISTPHFGSFQVIFRGYIISGACTLSCMYHMYVLHGRPWTDRINVGTRLLMRDNIVIATWRYTTALCAGDCWKVFVQNYSHVKQVRWKKNGMIGAGFYGTTDGSTDSPAGWLGWTWPLFMAQTVRGLSTQRTIACKQQNQANCLLGSYRRGMKSSFIERIFIQEVLL